MPKYRKKPVVIEAVQWFQDGDHPKVIKSGGLPGPRQRFYIETLEGEMLVSPGDWIIEGVAGEFYPCKPDIFEKTYERVEE